MGILKRASHSALPGRIFLSSAGVVSVKSPALLALTFLALTFTPPRFALYQEYQLAGSLAPAPSYSFGTGQYRAYSNDLFLKKDFFAFEYDLDSFYGDYAYAFHENFRAGANAKVHAFDYQNLNHIVDATTGAENKTLALTSAFYRAQAFAEARWGNAQLRYSPGVQKYSLSRRDNGNSSLSVESPGTAFVHQAALGYWNLSAGRPYAFTGIAAYLMTEAQQLSSTYVWLSGASPVSFSRDQVVISEAHVRAGTELASGALRLMTQTRAGMTNFAGPGESQDLVQSFSVGGPESRYRRLAGYQFSEFRVPAYGLVNLDAIVRMFGPVNLWFVADAALFDREYAGRRFHAGAGAGLIFDMPENFAGSRSALFVRAEVPFFAGGSNRFQIFMGMNGQVF